MVKGGKKPMLNQSTNPPPTAKRPMANTKMKKNGLIFSGMNKKLGVVEIIELKNHPWFVGCQFHPELKSRVDKAHPLFREFVKASLKNSKN